MDTERTTLEDEEIETTDLDTPVSAMPGDTDDSDQTDADADDSDSDADADDAG